MNPAVGSGCALPRVGVTQMAPAGCPSPPRVPSRWINALSEVSDDTAATKMWLLAVTAASGIAGSAARGETLRNSSAHFGLFQHPSNCEFGVWGNNRWSRAGKGHTVAVSPVQWQEGTSVGPCPTSPSPWMCRQVLQDWDVDGWYWLYWEEEVWARGSVGGAPGNPKSWGLLGTPPVPRGWHWPEDLGTAMQCHSRQILGGSP